MGKTINLNVLDNIEIATPCTASWEEMTGNDQQRYCSHCSLNVYNLSAMTREEAAGIITGAEGRVCVRLYRRTDGTVLTQDCPTGLRAARERVSRSIRNVAATVVTLMAGMFGLGARQAWAQGGVSARVVMGGVGRSVHVEPEEPKSQSDTAQAKQDTGTVDEPRTMIMGEMAIRPVEAASVPTKIQPAVTRRVAIEPAAEPIAIEQMRPRPLKQDLDDQVPGVVVEPAGTPEPEVEEAVPVDETPLEEPVQAADGTPVEEPACDLAVPAVDAIVGPEIR
ncbi:MAG: hypothetical protein JST22_01360 [Bacteroidetes bacterium]|nr:hypothetical protein [Bacteroidota bacterium]